MSEALYSCRQFSVGLVTVKFQYWPLWERGRGEGGGGGGRGIVLSLRVYISVYREGNTHYTQTVAW